MTEADIVRQFEESWEVSVSRARSRRGWHNMTLEEKKNHSSRFRRAMERYGRDLPGDMQTDVGVFASPGSSKEAG